MNDRNATDDGGRSDVAREADRDRSDVAREDGRDRPDVDNETDRGRSDVAREDDHEGRAGSTVSIAPLTDDAAVVRHGVDVVSIERIAALCSEFGESFRSRAFTRAERDYCESRGTPSQHYAARWAAKEAFYKLLDAESSRVPLDAIEVVREPSGPRLELHEPAGRALDDMLDRRGVDPETVGRDVSLSHDRTAGYAIASVTVFGIEE